jgi:hypothetical protein
MEFAMAGVLVFFLFMMLFFVFMFLFVMRVLFMIVFFFMIGIFIMAGIVFDIRFHRRFREPALCSRGQYEKFLTVFQFFNRFSDAILLVRRSRLMFTSNDICGRAGKFQMNTGSLHSRIQMGNAM